MRLIKSAKKNDQRIKNKKKKVPRMNCVIVRSLKRPSRKMDKKELFVFNMCYINSRFMSFDSGENSRQYGLEKKASRLLFFYLQNIYQ